MNDNGCATPRPRAYFNGIVIDVQWKLCNLVQYDSACRKDQVLNEGKEIRVRSMSLGKSQMGKAGASSRNHKVVNTFYFLQSHLVMIYVDGISKFLLPRLASRI